MQPVTEEAGFSELLRVPVPRRGGAACAGRCPPAEHCPHSPAPHQARLGESVESFGSHRVAGFREARGLSDLVSNRAGQETIFSLNSHRAAWVLKYLFN